MTLAQRLSDFRDTTFQVNVMVFMLIDTHEQDEMIFFVFAIDKICVFR